MAISIWRCHRRHNRATEGRIIQHIESPVDGIVFTLRENPVVYKGHFARVHDKGVMKKEVLYSLKGIYRENLR